MHITQERLKEICAYDPETGIFEGVVNRGQKYKAGDPFGRLAKKGYYQVTIDGITYHLQRLAWLYAYGEFPSDQIDHIDGDPGNNRIDNLRIANRNEQGWNRKAKPGRSLPKNIGFVKRENKYRVRINKNGAVAFCKLFSNLDEASAIAIEKRAEIHGDFARG